MLSLSSSAIAVVLAFHPFSAPSPGFAQRALAGAEPIAEPSDTAQPGWDEADPDPTTTTEDVPAPVVSPNDPSVPTVAPLAQHPSKPEYNKGTGLVIGASIAGGLAWVGLFARLALVRQCEDDINGAENVDTGLAAANRCFFRAGVANAAIGVAQYGLNAASWGLAIGSGIVRGRYDGIDRAWAGQPSRKSGAFIGAGAAILALGVTGRILAAAFVLRPFRALEVDENGNVDTGSFLAQYRARMVGVQVSSSAIGLGAGLLSYGVSHQKHYGRQKKVVEGFSIAPEIGSSAGYGLGYAGLAMSGRF